jgi:hypothetical protein
MAVTIKALANGQVQTSTTNLYPPPPTLFAVKAAIVKTMRFVNTSDTASATLDIYFLRSGGAIRQISPKGLNLPPHGMYVDDSDLTLEATTDAIQAKTSSAGTIDYVLSGVERDS